MQASMIWYLGAVLCRYSCIIRIVMMPISKHNPQCIYHEVHIKGSLDHAEALAQHANSSYQQEIRSIAAHTDETKLRREKAECGRALQEYSTIWCQAHICCCTVLTQHPIVIYVIRVGQDIDIPRYAFPPLAALRFHCHATVAAVNVIPTDNTPAFLTNTTCVQSYGQRYCMRM